ncbi:MAG TPA: XRE family transcriptional regulator [Stellaceae bacterium]|nr:XRE family transcriptional regulator [Stellaceae bacterium]
MSDQDDIPTTPAVDNAQEINPRVLRWARETAGLTLDEAAERLGLTTSARSSAADKLADIESGRKALTVAQLLRAATAYRRPLIVFYLAEPPARGERGEDFRTTGAQITPRDNAILDALLRDLRARQQLLLAMLEDEEEAVPLPFVGTALVGDDPIRVAAAIRSCLGVTLSAQREAKGPELLFALLRAAVERVGVYVLLLGDVGSYHTDIGENVFRGIAIADAVAPFIVINDNDAQAARSFTLLHELAHIWVGASGVSGSLASPAPNKVERFCNDVASELLLPAAALTGSPVIRAADFQTVLRSTEELARAWNVSQALVTYRYLRSGWISDQIAGELFGYFAERLRRLKQQSSASRDPEGAGPSYYTVRRHQLGRALLDVVRRGLQGDVITHTKAAKILGVSPASVGPLLARPGAA